MGRTAGAAALGFVLGCAVTYFLARRKAKEREGGGGLVSAAGSRACEGRLGTPTPTVPLPPSSRGRPSPDRYWLSMALRSTLGSFPP